MEELTQKEKYEALVHLMKSFVHLMSDLGVDEEGFTELLWDQDTYDVPKIGGSIEESIQAGIDDRMMRSYRE